MPGRKTTAQVTGMHKTGMTQPVSSDVIVIRARIVRAPHLIARHKENTKHV